MKMLKKVCVLLVIAITFVAVQPAGAETVEGIISAISTSPNVVTVDDTDVFGIKLNYLCNQYNICELKGEMVSIEVYQYECKDGTINLMATSIKVGDATITLR